MTSAVQGARVLIVDDEPPVAEMLARVIARNGYEVDIAEDGPKALVAIANRAPDVILLDLMLPGLNGFDICHRLKRELRTRLIPVVMITGAADRENRIRGLASGADDFLAKPVDQQELLVRLRSLVRMKRYTDDLDSAASMLMSLAVLIERRDGCTEGHCYRMANYATALGRRLGLGEEDVQALHRGGFLHDIGMLAVPDSVLNKTEALDLEEYETIKAHTTIGESLCAPLRSLQAVRPIIRSHHERLDGSGYPDGLRGDEIPVLAQIISVVDVFDAITSQRPYQRAQSMEQALGILRRQAAHGWRHHHLVQALAAIVDSGGFETFRRQAGTIE
jgi:putative two-component system response regulator